MSAIPEILTAWNFHTVKHNGMTQSYNYTRKIGDIAFEVIRKDPSEDDTGIKAIACHNGSYETQESMQSIESAICWCNEYAIHHGEK